MLFQSVVLKPQICAAGAAPAKKEEKKQLAESEDEDEGDDMGFGLFGDDDDVPASFPTARFEKETKSVHKAKTFFYSALVDNDECSVLPGANKVSSTISKIFLYNFFLYLD